MKIYARDFMKLIILLCASIAVLMVVDKVNAEESQELSEKQILLRKMYEMRIRNDNDRARSENVARSNVSLVTQSRASQTDSPTVTGMRNQTSVQLTRLEQQFRCMNMDVDTAGGNTVVICGDNSGDISGSNETVVGDKVTIIDN